MDLYTTENIAGRNVECLGFVHGNVAQAKHIGKDIAAVFKTIAGGEVKDYTELMKEARSTAIQRMIEGADSLGADAVVAVRFMSSDIVDTICEVMVYGTAVKFL